MLKRIILILSASLLLCAGALAEDRYPDFPMTAAQAMMRLDAVVPLTSRDVVLPPLARSLWGRFPQITAMESEDGYLWLILAEEPTLDSLKSTLTLKLDERITDHFTGEFDHTADGRPALRFSVPRDQEAEVKSCAVTTGQMTDHEGETVSVTANYNLTLTFTGGTVEVSGGNTDRVITFDREGRITRCSREGAYAYEAGYDQAGELSYAVITAQNPHRVYYYEGQRLATIRDDDLDLMAYYDTNTGMMTHYIASRPIPDSLAVERVTFSPYGSVIEIAFPRDVDDWALSYAFWSPNFGWHLADEEDLDRLFLDGSEEGLPDPAAYAAPLPALSLPDYRMDIRAISDLPRLPWTMAELPRVLELTVNSGVATVTLDRALDLPRAIPCFRNRWDSYADAIHAASAGSSPVYMARIPADCAAEDLSFDIVLPAENASQFTYSYAYDSLTRSWQVTLSSPAASFRVDCTPEGRPVTAEIADALSGETDYCRLTFDEETGALTSYEYYIELPFVHRGGWYSFTYLPGQGIISAVCGDRSTGRFVWNPANGWVDLLLGTASDDLLDPLTFPFPYPFPEDE